MQTVYLNGGISKFGSPWKASCTNIRDIFKLIECQTPGFRKYLVDAAENNVGFEIKRGKEFLESPEELLLSLNEEDVIITEVPAGSKSGGAKILAAIAIIAIVVFTAGAGAPAAAPAGAGGAGGAGGAVGGTMAQMGVQMNVAMQAQYSSYLASQAGFMASLSTAGQFGLMVGVNLALSGISQLMAPGPETDAATENESYLFNGPVNGSAQGFPVPLMYGELIIGGSPISSIYSNTPFNTMRQATSISVTNVTTAETEQSQNQSGQDVPNAPTVLQNLTDTYLIGEEVIDTDAWENFGKTGGM